jgi:phosphoribosylformylglycinamidine cyclo-ligase
MNKDNAEDYERREAAAVSAGKANMGKMFFDRRVGRGGLFAEVRENKAAYPNHYMLLAIDGVGTKIFLSEWMERYDTIGHDLVAMNMNDLATFGAVIPDVFNIYFAVQSRVEEEKMGEIVKGIDDALRLCLIDADINMNYGKCETASIDEMVAGPVAGYGYDLAASATAFIENARMPSFEPKPGDLIIGFASSGLHSNGYTAARHVLLSPAVEGRKEWRHQYRGHFMLDDTVPGSKENKMTVGEALLEPTRLYFRAMSRIASQAPGIFGVNITGYGLKNFNRFGECVTYHITDPLPPHPIHNLIVREGGYSVEEAFTKLNMGMGFAVIARRQAEADIVLEIAKEEGITAKIIGDVSESAAKLPRVMLHKGSRELGGGPVYCFDGYG